MPRFALLSAAATLLYLLVVGIVTAVIPNPLFDRMTPVTPSNVVFWVVPAVLAGPLAASYLSGRKSCEVGNQSVAGGALSFLAVGCPLCNKVVVLLLGTTGALTYFEPVQPLLGAASVLLLGYALWLRLRPPAGSFRPHWRQSRPPLGG